MKIKRIIAENVKGIPNNTYELPQIISIISGPNGSGKSTIMDLIQFLFYGSKLPDYFVKNGAKKGILTYILDINNTEHEVTISKTATDGADMKCKLNQKTTSLKNIREFITTQIGSGEIVRYSEVLNNMKPKELADKLLSYIPDCNNKADILNFLSKEYKSKNLNEENYVEWTQGNQAATDVLNSLLPDVVEQKHITNALEQCKSTKANLKKTIESLQYSLFSLNQYDYSSVTKTATQIKEEIATIQAELQNRDTIANAWEQYNNTVNLINSYNQNLHQLSEQIHNMTVIEPNQDEITNANSLLTQWSDYRQSLIQTLNSHQSSLKMFSEALERLNTSVCPLSDKIRCTVDKTPIQSELRTNIDTLTATINEISQKITEADANLEKIREDIKKKEETVLLWKNKQQLIERYNQMIANQPQTPIPPAIQVPDLQAKQTLLLQLQNELAMAERKEQLYLVTGQLSEAHVQYHIYNYLTRELDPKGTVMECIMMSYVSHLNALIDNKVLQFSQDWKIGFIFDNGIVPTLTNLTQNKVDIPYPVLSTGEKAIVALFITDMLNALSTRQITDANGNVYYTGSKTLLIDDIEKLDEINFNNFISTLQYPDILNRYDNIVINMVNHSDIVQQIIQFSNINHIQI